MSIISVAGACVICCAACLIIKQFSAQTAAVISAACACLFLLYAVVQISPLISFIKEISAYSALSGYADIMIKAAGIAFVTYVACDICKSAGEVSLAGAVEMIGKLAILSLCIPLMRKLLDFAGTMLNS